MSVYRRNSQGYIIKRGDGTWWYDFVIDGRRYKRALRGIRTRKEAEAIESQVRASVYCGTYGKQREAIEFTKFAETIYLQHAKVHLKGSFENVSRFVKHCCRYFKNKPLDEITRGDIEAFRQHRLNTPANGQQQKKPNTINREMMQLSGIFTLAVKREYLQSNPVKGLTPFKANNQRERVITPAEEKLLLDAASEKLRPIIVLGLNTGLRLGSLVGLKWGYVDLERREIAFPSGTMKNGKRLVIPINDTAHQVLTRLHETSGKKANVFAGVGYTRHNISVAISNLCDRIGLTDVTAHTMRHTFATRLMERNINPLHVKELLGHSSLRMTAGYTHIGLDALRESVKTLVNSSDKSEPVPAA